MSPDSTVTVRTPRTAIKYGDIGKNPAGPMLTLDPATFTTFVDWTSTTAE
ncbi:DUF397 domain-containing protein [Streptomyces hawaiiensis]